MGAEVSRDTSTYLPRLKRGLFRLWVVSTAMWFGIVGVVGLEDAVRDWRRWALDATPDGIVDRTMAWIPSFRLHPLTEEEMSAALRSMEEGLSLTVTAQAHPDENDPFAAFEDPFDSPDSPSYAAIESIPVGMPPKLMTVRFLDGSQYQIEFPREFESDLETVKANIRDLLMGLCSASPRRCRGSKPNALGLLAQHGGILFLPPVMVLLLGYALLWIAHGFSSHAQGQ